MTTQVFHLPDLGEGLTEAVVVAWLIGEGDEVTVDQPIAEVETAKSIVELPTPYAGTVLKLYGSAGDAIATGAPVIEVGSGADAGVESVVDAGVEAEVGLEAEAYRSEERAGSGNVLIGYGTGSVGSKGRRRRTAITNTANAANTANTAPASTESPNVVSATPAPEPGAGTVHAGPVAVRSPIVRRLARDLGVDVHAVSATGSDGAVTRHDVLAAAAPHAQTRPSSLPEPARAGTTEPGLDELHGLAVVERTPLSPLRKMVASKLSRSRAEIPEATVWVDVDFTELWRLRRHMAETGEQAPSVTALVARFALLALSEFPLLASRLSNDGAEISTFDGVNLGLAVDSERGLTVPVLPHADRLQLGELDTALKELSAEARTGRIAPAKLTGSTFTFNNYGAFGVDGSAPIINYPDVAMLGMGRVIERPWVVGGEIVVRRIAQMSFVFDHRVCDGGYASGFLRRVVDLVEHPMSAFVRV